MHELQTPAHRVDVSNRGGKGDEDVHVGSTVLHGLVGRHVELVPTKHLQTWGHQIKQAEALELADTRFNASHHTAVSLAGLLTYPCTLYRKQVKEAETMY